MKKNFEELMAQKLASNVHKGNIYSPKKPYDDDSIFGINASISQVDAIKRVWKTSAGKSKILKWLLFATAMSALRNERGKIYDVTYILSSTVLPSTVVGIYYLAIAGIKPAYLDIIYKGIIGESVRDEILKEDKKFQDEIKRGNFNQQSDPMSSVLNKAKSLITGKSGKVDKIRPYLERNTYNEETNMQEYITVTSYKKLLDIEPSQEDKEKNEIIRKPAVFKKNKNFDYGYGSIVVIGSNFETFIEYDKVDELSDLQYFPFYIKDLRKGSSILLNAYVSNEFSERFDISLNEFRLLHRINNISSWSTTKKSYDLKFTLFATDRDDLMVMQEKLQYIRDLAYPIFDKAGLITSPACIFKIKFGSLLNNKRNTGLFAILNSLEFSSNCIVMDAHIKRKYNYRHFITNVTMLFNTIDEYPSCDANNPFYNANEEKSIGDLRKVKKINV